MFGNVLLVVFGDHSQQGEYSVEVLERLLVRREFLVFITAIMGVAVAAYVLYKLNKRSILKKRRLVSDWQIRVMPFLFALYFSIVGAQAVIFAKAAALLVKAAVAKGDVLSLLRPDVITIVVLWLATMVFWVVKYNSAVRKWSATLIIPLCQLLWTVLVVASAGIFFREFEAFRPLQFAMFGVAIAFMLWGVHYLTPADVTVELELILAIADELEAAEAVRAAEEGSKGEGEKGSIVKRARERRKTLHETLKAKRNRDRFSTFNASVFALNMLGLDREADEGDLADVGILPLVDDDVLADTGDDMLPPPAPRRRRKKAEGDETQALLNSPKRYGRRKKRGSITEAFN